MTNQYTKITKYYDLWVTSGYYDYQTMAQEANQIIGNGRKILELGVGTGLLAQKYLEIDPNCEFTGVDFTASMLEIAQTRLGDKVKLVEADVVTMDLNQKFEVAICMVAKSYGAKTLLIEILPQNLNLFKRQGFEQVGEAIKDITVKSDDNRESVVIPMQKYL